MEARFVYITTQDKSEARKIGRALVESRLAACANILDGMESIYWWDGEVEQAQECVLALKTAGHRMQELIARVRELHSYACPCIVSFRIDDGNPDYLKWIAAECAAADA